MRIDLNTGAAIGQGELQNPPEKAARSGAAGISGESHFSHSAASVSGLAASALQAPELRAEKIQALQAQIAAGTYQVSPQQIASFLLEQLRAVK